ncbi:MAG: hypothetical protein AAFN70_17500, partial [Planctomycetota bacterium]
GVQRSINRAELLRQAAALEGISERLYYDLNRYRGQLRPINFQSSCCDNARNFYDSCKRLHYDLARGVNLQQLQPTCNTLIDRWQTLSPQLQTLNGHGLTDARYNQVYSRYESLLPVLGQVSAALIP